MLLLSFVLPAIGFAQKSKDYELLNCRRIETPAVLPGGPSAFLRLFERHFQYSDSIPNYEISGGVTFSFVVTRDGTLSEIKILKEIGFGIDEEVIRVLKLCPKWTPAQMNGRNVSWRGTQTIRFCLADDLPAKKQVRDFCEDLIS